MTKEHLIHLLELGHSVHYNDDCTIAFYFKDDNVFVSIKGQRVRLNEHDFQNGTFKIVTPAPKLLPVGTKVVVLDNYYVTSLVGMKLLVNDISKDKSTYYLIDGLRSSGVSIPHWAVAPIEVTEPHKYQEVIDLIERTTDNYVSDEMRYSADAVKKNLLERIKNLK